MAVSNDRIVSIIIRNSELNKTIAQLYFLHNLLHDAKLSGIVEIDLSWYLK